MKNNESLKNIKLRCLPDITKDSYTLFGLDNSFCTFKSINNILILIYSNIDYSLIFCDLLNNKKVSEIKHAHNSDIGNIRNYLDTDNKRDLILSISIVDNNIKIWNLYNLECIINIENINNKGILKSSCFLYDNKNHQIFIASSNFNSGNYQDLEPIKIFDLKGKKAGEIKNSNDVTIYIESFYDSNLSLTFIITGNNGCIKSYNMNTYDICKKYKDEKDYFDHTSIIIFFDESIKMIESCGDGNIRIWNFHLGDLLEKIKISDSYLYGICFLDKDNIIVGCRDKKMKQVDIKNKILKNEFQGYNKDVITIKKINHPKYGNCLISQGKYNEQIKLWIIEN